MVVEEAWRRRPSRRRRTQQLSLHGQVAVVVRAVVPRALGDLRATYFRDGRRAAGRGTGTATPSMIRNVHGAVRRGDGDALGVPACRLPMALLLRTVVTLSSSLNLPGITRRVAGPEYNPQCSFLAHAMEARREAAGKAAGCLRRPNVMRKRREFMLRGLPKFMRHECPHTYEATACAGHA